MERDAAWSLELYANDWDGLHHLSTRGVSRAGLFVRLDEPPAAGTPLAIVIRLPDRSTLAARGVVAHAFPFATARAAGMAPGFAVRFDTRHDLDFALLEAMASSHGGGLRHPDGAYVDLAAQVREPNGRRDAEHGEHVAHTRAYHLVADHAVAGASSSAAASAPAAPAESPAAAAPRPLIPVPEDAIFGLDFGTSYTSIAVVTPEGLHVLRDAGGYPQFPSVVCYPEMGPPIVGWAARERIATHPGTTFVSPKRLLGRAFDDRRVEALLHGSPVHYGRGPAGQVVADVYGEVLAMPQICAEVFRHAAEVAEQATGTRPRQIVVSAPVGYVGERRAIVRAAQLAGLQVMRVVDEPVAAAMAYGLGRGRDEVVAVYDFGGGTFDFTLLRIQDNKFQVLGESGDAWLGGDDFDLALATDAADLFLRQRQVDLRQRQVEWQRLLHLAEGVKRKLSVEHRAQLLARGILLSIRGPIDLRMVFDRRRLADLCGPLVDRSIETMDACIQLAGLTPRDIHQVVLTGGVTRIPLVRERLSAYFAREVGLTVKPEEAVVRGDAIYGRFLALSRRRSAA